MRVMDVTSEKEEQRSVLVADDDEGMRSMLYLLFSRLGFRVVLAKDGREAFELFSREPASLILTDFCMPEMDGLTLAAMVKKVSPSTPIIMITGSRVQEGVATSYIDYIVSKPFHVDEIQRTVEMALSRAIFKSGTQHGAEIHLQG